MIRSIRSMLLMAFAALAIFAIPGSSYAAQSCIDQFYVCINDASKYDGGSLHLAEAECSVEYVGCVAAKLKFW